MLNSSLYFSHPFMMSRLGIKEEDMGKGQKSNKEVKKPKKQKAPVAPIK
jgi:hypothetical protein